MLKQWHIDQRNWWHNTQEKNGKVNGQDAPRWKSVLRCKPHQGTPDGLTFHFETFRSHYKYVSKHIHTYLILMNKLCQLLVAQMIKNLPAMHRPRFSPWVGNITWRRKWQPTQVFLPGKFHGQRNFTGCRPWGCKESDMTEWLSLHF